MGKELIASGRGLMKGTMPTTNHKVRI